MTIGGRVASAGLDSVSVLLLAGTLSAHRTWGLLHDMEVLESPLIGGGHRSERANCDPWDDICPFPETSLCLVSAPLVGRCLFA